MNDREARAFHARRLLVAPPRRYQARQGPWYRVGRVLVELLDYAFAVFYGLLVARLVLLLMESSLSTVLTRMLRPVTDPVIGPLANVLPPLLPEPLDLLLPVVAAIVVAVLAHWVLRQAVQRLALLHHGKGSSAAGTLIHRVLERDDRVRVVDTVGGL